MVETTYLIKSRKAIIVLLKFLTVRFQRITLKQKKIDKIIKQNL